MTPETDIATVLRETPVRYGNESEDQSKVRRQREREAGAAEIDRLRAEVAALKAHPEIPVARRKVVQLVPVLHSPEDDPSLYALADDGTMWQKYAGCNWTQLPEIPQPSKEQSR